MFLTHIMLEWRGSEITVLPKGHGRLIDADKIFDALQFGDFSSSDDLDEALMIVGTAPTIIEADSEVTYGKQKRNI